MTWVFESAVHKHLERKNPNKPISDGVSKNASLRKGLYPFSDPESLPNCKRYVIIKRDGSIVESAYLNINQMDDRENIIVHHLLVEIVRSIGNETIGLNLLGRDNPWDFTFEFSTGAVKNFEITSVSDNRDFFKRLAREEFMQTVILEKETRVSKLRKAVDYFPELSETSQVRDLLSQSASDSEIDNPIFGLDKKLFVSTEPVYPTDRPEKDILGAIDAKAQKQHQGKRETILVIDNRFICAGLDFLLETLAPYEKEIFLSPFEEIWLYTGYGGHYFGRDGEFAVFPLKLHPSACEKYLSSEINRMPWH